MNQLIQRYFLSHKSFELKENRILIKEKSIFDDKEWEARYDEIGLDLIKIKSREGIGNAILFGGLFIITALMTFRAFTEQGTDLKLAFLFLFFCIMWATIFWWSVQKYFAAHFVLQGGQKTITFFISSPDENTVREFIEELRSRVKLKLREELTVFDPDLTFEDQLDHLKYLKRIEVLPATEFDLIREQLRKQHLLK